MKKIFSLLTLTAVLATASALLAAPAGKSDLADQKSKSSYALGQQIGKDLKENGALLEPALIADGLRDAFAGTSRLSEAEQSEGMAKLQEGIMRAHLAKQKQLADKNQQEGKKFLAANAKKKGVKTTASGLQYQVVNKGKGKKAGPESTVTVHYRGTLIDDTEFDSSLKRGEPATFPVTGVIPGWVEALQLMKEGDKFNLVLPPELAYGERGAGDAIGPNAVLLFEVELLKVE